jgi:hypothetical protein
MSHTRSLRAWEAVCKNEWHMIPGVSSHLLYSNNVHAALCTSEQTLSILHEMAIPECDDMQESIVCW